MKTTTLVLLTASTLLLSQPTSAQIQEDPRQKMQEILDSVAKEMQQIDKWLQESSRSKDAAKGMKKNVQRLNELLDSVGKSQQSVVKGIDDLLKEAQKMKSKGDPSDPLDKSQKQKQKQRQQRQKQDQKQQQERQRQRRLQKPEQNQPQDQKNDDPKNEPRNNRKEEEKGRNELANKPPGSETEKVNAKKVQGAWGALPDYVLKHGRGSMPDVPEKYRKYLDALHKQSAKKNKKK